MQSGPRFTLKINRILLYEVTNAIYHNSMLPKISVCIASHNQGHLLLDALLSCLKQDYNNTEIIVLDDASTDDTSSVVSTAKIFAPDIKYIRSEKPSGSGGAFNKAMDHARGDYLVLLCADDVFTDHRVLSDIVKIFMTKPKVAHVSRYYHQFIGQDRRPVRAWRCNNVIELANNPSGLAFRRTAITRCQLSNKMFVEAPSLVCCVMQNPANFAMIMPWDTVAVRIHQSTARSHAYYRKMWTSSPVVEWSKIGGKSIQKDYTSLIQIANYFTRAAVLIECWNFIRLRPLNLITPSFVFFAIVSIFTPRWALIRLPHLYRITIGRWTTKEVRRP